MNLITFPKHEWNDIQDRLEKGKIVFTIRVGREHGKYKTGDVLKTEWDSEIEIVSVEKLKGGMEELKNSFEFFAELTKDMIQELNGYDEMEIITFKQVQKD